MTIVVGMLLYCQVKLMGIGTYGFFLKDVPTKVLYIKSATEVLVEFDYPSMKSIRTIENVVTDELVNPRDLVDGYMQCRIKK